MNGRAIARRIIRLLLLLIMVLMVATIVFYLAVYALQRHSLGDDAALTVIALLIGAAFVLARLFDKLHLARLIGHILAGNQRHRSD